MVGTIDAVRAVAFEARGFGREVVNFAAALVGEFMAQQLAAERA